MAAFRIAVIGGDGIGPEVIEQAVRVVDRAAPVGQGQAACASGPCGTRGTRRSSRTLPQWHRYPAPEVCSTAGDV